MSLAEISFTKICSVHDIEEDSGKRFIINETEIAVIKSDGKIFALSNICPHQQTALIYDGIIEDGCVVCPQSSNTTPTREAPLESSSSRFIVSSDQSKTWVITQVSAPIRYTIWLYRRRVASCRFSGSVCTFIGAGGTWEPKL